MYHDGIAGAGKKLLVPDRLIELLGGNGPAPVFHQAFQDGILRIRQRRRLSSVFYHSGVEVDFEVATGPYAGCRLAPVFLIASQERPHLCQQLRLGERLGEEIVPAALIGRQAVSLLALRRQEKDRHIGEAADHFTGLNSVHSGHHHIQNNQIRIRVGAHVFHGGLSVFGLRRLIVSPQQELQDVADIRIVIHDQDF